MASYDNTKYWHVLDKFGKIVHNLEWTHIHVVLTFALMLPWANLIIDTNGVIFLVAASSIHDTDDKYVSILLLC